MSPYRNLALASPHYVEQAADWPENYDLIGFTSWDGPEGGRLPDDVEAFLAAGPPRSS